MVQQELQKEKFDLEGEVKKYLSKAEGQTVSDATHIPMTEQEVQCIIDIKCVWSSMRDLWE